MHLSPPLQVLIVEDLLDSRQYLEQFLQQLPGFMVAGSCGSVQEAIRLINHTKPDLLLLDIGLPDGTGFDILERIPEPLKVVFLTAYSEYAIRAMHYGAIDYLLKPYTESELRESLQKVVLSQPLLPEQIDITLNSYRKTTPADRIVLRTHQCLQVVTMNEITYLHGDSGYTTVFLSDGKKIVTSKTIKDFEELLGSAQFIRTHKSYLVNEMHIARYHQKQQLLYLRDGTPIPVAYRKKGKVRSIF